MSSPKEKAIELVEKYKPYMYCYMGSGMLSNTYDENTVLQFAKKSAIICVDEILNTDNNFIQTEAQQQYWNEVKNEINKL